MIVHALAIDASHRIAGHRVVKRWRATLAFSAMATCVTASAATYTCVGADGKKSFSDRPCPAATVGASRRDAGAGGYPTQRFGLTFGLQPLPDDTVSANCQATPSPQDRPRDGGCDAERGDTVCSRALPVLCIKKPERRARTAAAVDANTGRMTAPPAGEALQLGASPTVRGDSLASSQSGTEACASALGSGWRMLTLQDSVSWPTPPRRHDSLSQASGRFWVAVGDAPANCWNAPPPPAGSESSAAKAAPAAEQPLLAELLKLRSSPEFASLPLKCRQGFDKVERALRQDKGGGPVGEAPYAPMLEWLQACDLEGQAKR